MYDERKFWTEVVKTSNLEVRVNEIPLTGLKNPVWSIFLKTLILTFILKHAVLLDPIHVSILIQEELNPRFSSFIFLNKKFIKWEHWPPTLTKAVMVHIFSSSKQQFVASPLPELLPDWKSYCSLPLVLHPSLAQSRSLNNLSEMRIHENTNLTARWGPTHLILIKN